MFNLRDKEERHNTLKTFFLGGTFIMCLWVVFPYLLRAFIDPHLRQFSPKNLRWLGVCLSAAGYFLAVWCVTLFIRQGKGTPLPFACPRKLVTGGPYRLVRNPMVIGTVLFLLGSAFVFGSPGILIYAFLVFMVMHFFVLIEERALLKRFGGEYAAYRDKTPRWCAVRKFLTDSAQSN